MIRRALVALLLASVCLGQSSPEHKSVADRLKAVSSVELNDCKWHADDLLNPQDPALSEADWTPIKHGEQWDSTPRWFRCDVTMPEKVGGLSTRQRYRANVADSERETR